MADVEAGTTLREQLASAIDEQETESVVETPVSQPEAVETPEAPETPAEKAGRLAGRARDELGRVLPGKAAPVVAAPVVEIPKPRPARPSSWKKEMWDHWEKLDPAVAEYVHQREQEAARGVSTYKQEYDQAKPLIDAMAPFQPLLQQHNIQPGQWITNLGNAHRQLALGSPQEKLQMFHKLAQDYGVNLQGLGVEQGQVDQFQQLNPLFEEMRQLKGELNNFKSSQEQQAQQQMQSELQKFASTHPHYEMVRGTMAGLLQSGLAENLDDAHDKAIRLHDDIWQQEQEAKAQAEAAKKLELTKKTVSKARANDLSVRSATPSGSATGATPTGLRASLEAAADEHLASRV